MASLQLEQAAESHSAHKTSPVGSILYIHKTTAFKAGAEWQKEQFKELLPLIKEAMVVCSIEGQDDIIERIEAHILNLGLEL